VAVHPWVAEAKHGLRWGVQLITPNEPNALQNLLITAATVEDLGYDYLSIFDHPLMHVDPWIALSGIATRTKRVRLGSTVNCAYYRHPAYLVRLATDLDNLSNGRHVLGLGSGWLRPEFAALGLDFGTFSERSAALEDTLAIVRGVWNEPPFSFEGRIFSTVDMEAVPPPVQKPAPPILVAGNGEKVTLRQVAMYADASNMGAHEWIGSAVSSADIARKFSKLDGYLAEVGRTPDSVLRSQFTMPLVMAENEAALEAKMSRMPQDVLEWCGDALFAGTPHETIAFYQDLVDAGFRYFIGNILDGDYETITLMGKYLVPHFG